ncbi:MAG: 4-hydroxybutyrate dehydrogenase [Bacteroidales bacterium]|nr:4-hydroxybutyrate dehydrogenase [Bacteroidales bacterium]
MFTIKTTISNYQSFSEFAKEFALSENDLIITRSSLYEPFMKPLNLPCTFVLQNEYGSGEPSDEMINNILKEVKGKTYNRVVGVGGGTVIDIAKLFVLKDLDNVTDAFERKIPIVKEKQLVIVPTTCGTGSEVTNISIAEIKSKHTKMGLADNAILPDDAVLIPELLKGLPFKFYAYSAIDALIHAMESYLSPKANAHTQLFSKRAIEMILNVFMGIAEHGEDYRFGYLEEMLTASNFAGIAFGNAGVGAVHALSYPLGGGYHVPHGESNYQFLTEVFKVYFKKNPDGSIRELNDILARNLNIDRELLKSDPRIVFQMIDEILSKLVPKNPLRQYGMKPAEIDEFPVSVLKTQQRLLANNYVPLDEEEIRGIYQALY